jgi:hypothetical protein
MVVERLNFSLFYKEGGMSCGLLILLSQRTRIKKTKEIVSSGMQERKEGNPSADVPSHKLQT